jgi:hypothetical protein
MIILKIYIILLSNYIRTEVIIFFLFHLNQKSKKFPINNIIASNCEKKNVINFNNCFLLNLCIINE